MVAFTASVTANDRSRIGEAGFDAFIGKPINLKEFVETVRRHAGSRRAAVNATPKILVVDDTPANVKLLVDVLTAKGYAVTLGGQWRAGAGDASPSRRPTWCCSTS